VDSETDGLCISMRLARPVVLLLTLAASACDAARTNLAPKTGTKTPAPATPGPVYPVFRLDSLPTTIAVGDTFTVFAFSQEKAGAAFGPCDSCWIDDKYVVHHPDTNGELLEYLPPGLDHWPAAPSRKFLAVRAGLDTIGLGRDNRELLTPIVVQAGAGTPPPAPAVGYPMFRLDSVPTTITVGDTFAVYAFVQTAPGAPFVPCDSCWINLRDSGAGSVAYATGLNDWPAAPWREFTARSPGVDTLQAGRDNQETQVPITILPAQ